MNTQAIYKREVYRVCKLAYINAQVIYKRVFGFESELYALSGSKVIFTVRTDSIELIKSGDDDYLMNETYHRIQCPTLFNVPRDLVYAQVAN